MTLTWPIWLILAAPLAISLWLWRLPSRLLMVLRAAALVMIVLAMCGAGVWLPSRSGTVIVLADRSLSMLPDAETAQKEAVALVRAEMSGSDRLAVVSFGRQAVVEHAPQQGNFAGFMADVGREASNLADGLDMALSTVSPGDSARVLVLSDGRATGRDPAAALARAASMGVAVDYRSMQRSTAGDLAVAGIDSPASVAAGESYMITAWLDSPARQEVSYELTGGGRVVARGRQEVPSGRSRLMFRDQSEQAGTVQYTLSVTRVGADPNAAPDPVPENNTARLLVGVRGPRPILCVSTRGPSALAVLLARGGLEVRSVTPDQCRWSLEDLAGYSAVLIENTPATAIGTAGMESLAAWVTQMGRGMMMTGGQEAYGRGGYFRSPLEPVMPVSMELRREHRKLSLAIVVALDRSGSMAMTTPDGRQKIELAALASAEVLDLLSGMDQFGCIAVDSAPHVIAPLEDVTNKRRVRNDILRIDSQGGGIFIYEALSNAAKMIADAKAGTRHIILFADANDSEEPGAYVELLKKCRAAGVTVSVIGLGTEKDKDADLLKDIAKLGGGQCFFTESAQELPRLFAQDTFVVARSAFLEQNTAIHSTAGMVSLSGRSYSPMPTIGGYNLCYLRDGANLAAVTVDEYKAPVVAAWQAGVGRVLCYTGEADGKHTGEMARWANVGEMFTSLARWTVGDTQNLPDGAMLTQELAGGLCRITLHLDPRRQRNPFTRLPQATMLVAEPGKKPEPRQAALQWETADTLVTEIPLYGRETLLSSVELDGGVRSMLAPTCLPYCPEFTPQRADEGLRTLERLARSTGGQQRVNLADIWKDLPRKPRLFPLAPWLLPAAIVLFLLEVLHRRTGLVSLGWVRHPLRRGVEWMRRGAGAVLQTGRRRRPRPAIQPSGAPAASAEPTQPPPFAPAAPPRKSAPPKDDADSMESALDRARKAARGRTKR